MQTLRFPNSLEASRRSRYESQFERTSFFVAARKFALIVRAQSIRRFTEPKVNARHREWSLGLVPQVLENGALPECVGRRASQRPVSGAAINTVSTSIIRTPNRNTCCNARNIRR